MQKLFAVEGKTKGKVTMHRIMYHMDADGHAAGAVVYKYLTENNIYDEDIAWHPINYGMPIPEEIDYENDHVYMVDFSLQPVEVMIEFAEKLEDRLTWVDHHQTSVDMIKVHDKLRVVLGWRMVKDGTGAPISGCELTWKCLFHGKSIPEVLKLVGDWDTWRYTDYDEDRQEDVRAFQYFLKSFESEPNTRPGRRWWLKAFDRDEVMVAQNYCDEGRDLLEYQQGEWYSLVKNKGFVAGFQGLRAVMVNQTGNSTMFDGFFDPEKHDIMVSFQLVQGKYLTVSLYTPKTEQIHLGHLAKELGEVGDMPSGGGHAGAAGFQCSWEYFKTLYTVTGDLEK